MNFSLAAILAVVLLVVSTVHTTHTRIPLSRRTNAYRSDGSVDLEALKRETDHSIAKIFRGLLNYERNTGQRHPLSLGVRDFKRAIESNPLTNEAGQVWLGTVYVGTPPVAFQVDFDTGSSDFVIPAQGCRNCRGAQYNPAASSTSVDLEEPFEVVFGDGSQVSGSLYNDTVNIAGLVATRQTFGAAEEVTDEYRGEEDGLVGMAFRSLSSYDANPVFQNLVDQGQTTSPVFALKLTAGDSELTLGGLISDLYTGPITWVPLNVQQHWQIDFDSLEVDGQVVVGQSTCIIDSGTTLIVGGDNVVAQFYSLIPGSRPEGDGFYRFPCDAELPDLSFYLSGKRFSFTNSFNFGERDPVTRECLGGMRGREGMEWWILGGAFMTNYYTIFHIGIPGVSGAELCTGTQNTSQTMAHEYAMYIMKGNCMN